MTRKSHRTSGSRLEACPARKSLKEPADSLLRIPLLKQAIDDPAFRFLPRKVDSEWRYNVPSMKRSVAGFNPFVFAYFFPHNSLFAKWFTNPAQSGRQLNDGDFLVKEVFFAVHDYLHAWSVSAIRELAPELEFGSAKITSKNFEDFVFCHLLTETVATVGLDYWYLSLVDFNSVCDLGTDMQSLATSFSIQDIGEFRKFNPDFEVESKSFFKDLLNLYCDGYFPGFDVEDLRQSAKLRRWIQHELVYSEYQRRYIREWLSYLSKEDIELTEDQLTREFPCSDTAWKRDLTDKVAELLWEKVKSGRPHYIETNLSPEETWRSGNDRRFDFRFLNLNCFDIEKLLEKPEKIQTEGGFDYFFNQLVASHVHESFDPQLKKLFPFLREKKDPLLAYSVVKTQKRISSSTDSEWRDLLLYN